MDQRTFQIFFPLLRSAIRGEDIAEGEKQALSEAQLEELTALAKKHDMLHLLALGLKQNGMLPAGSNLTTYIFTAVYRYELLNGELARLCDALENAGIDFMPLKGSVLRKYYPEPWMRTSCDIDILVHEEDAENAAAFLVEALGYTLEGKATHDISLHARAGVHLELHYDLVEKGLAGDSSKVLQSVWDTAHLHEDRRFWYEMPDEMFYFYHIAHMAKHFENGGCGIRPFVDIWVLDRIEGADFAKRDELLSRGKLERFAAAARRLSRVWLGVEGMDDLALRMQSYVFRGGVYGTSENRIAMQQQKRGGRLRYALSKIFLPYRIIKYHYPILQRHPWLLPVMEVRRWGKLIFCGHRKRVVKELKYNGNLSEEAAAAAQALLTDLGL